MSETHSNRYVTVIRALALASTLGAAACGPPDVPGYMVVQSSQGGYCVCCPSGDWSGNCYSNPMVAPDAGGPGAPMTPPDGYHWCTGADLRTNAGGPSCPIAGPLTPPELPA